MEPIILHPPTRGQLSSMSFVQSDRKLHYISQWFSCHYCYLFPFHLRIWSLFIEIGCHTRKLLFIVTLRSLSCILHVCAVTALAAV